MKYWKQWVFSLGLLGLIAEGYAQVDVNSGPGAVVQNAIQEVLTDIKADPSLRQKDKASDLITRVVVPHFDVTRMTRLAVGKNWRSASPEQQSQLQSAFQTLLVRTYATSLSQFNNQTMVVKSVDTQGNDSVVHTQLASSGAQPIGIDYSMEANGSNWLVYDMVIDGVSLITNYRSEFANEVRQNGIDGLIRALNKKNKSSS